MLIVTAALCVPGATYVPGATRTVSPASAASIAAWMFVAAVAHVLNAGALVSWLPVRETYNVRACACAAQSSRARMAERLSLIHI